MKKVIMSMQPNINKTIEEVNKEFILNCEIRNFSKYTINHYNNQMHVFSLYCNFNQNITVLTKQLFDEYILYCKNKGISDITVQTYTKVIRTFYYFCMDRNYINTFKIHLPKADKPLKETYTDIELEKLLKKPNIKKASFTEYRTWVIINYVLATGNRMNTITNLKIKDLDFDNQIIKLIKTKNKKQQIIPMTNSLKEILIEYLSIRQGDLDDYVFCTAHGNICGKTCITQSLISYNHNRGIKKNITSFI